MIDLPASAAVTSRGRGWALDDFAVDSLVNLSLSRPDAQPLIIGGPDLALTQPIPGAGVASGPI